jgi:gas vesicle protein
MNTGKAILAVLVGAAAGAALGILLAPEKGSDTRKKIIKKGEDLASSLNEKIDEKFDHLVATITGKSRKAAVENGSGAKVESNI